jgi:hypothetical protein
MAEGYTVEPELGISKLLIGAHFIDAHRVTGAPVGLGAADAARLMLAQPPTWIVGLLAIRNALVTPFGERVIRCNPRRYRPDERQHGDEEERSAAGRQPCVWHAACECWQRRPQIAFAVCWSTQPGRVRAAILPGSYRAREAAPDMIKSPSATRKAMKKSGLRDAADAPVRPQV